VRELVGIIQKAFVMGEGDDLTEALEEAMGVSPSSGLIAPGSSPRSLTETTDQATLRILKQAAARCRTTREMAAYLGVSQSTVVRKLAKYGMGLE